MINCDLVEFKLAKRRFLCFCSKNIFVAIFFCLLNFFSSCGLLLFIRGMKIISGLNFTTSKNFLMSGLRELKLYNFFSAVWVFRAFQARKKEIKFSVIIAFPSKQKKKLLETAVLLHAPNAT